MEENKCEECFCEICRYRNTDMCKDTCKGCRGYKWSTEWYCALFMPRAKNRRTDDGKMHRM